MARNNDLIMSVTRSGLLQRCGLHHNSTLCNNIYTIVDVYPKFFLFYFFRRLTVCVTKETDEEGKLTALPRTQKTVYSTTEALLLMLLLPSLTLRHL